jgi:hypothetical protein
MGDLSLDPSTIEDCLTASLELLTKWGVALLLVEADVFLEAQNTFDLEYNEMASILPPSLNIKMACCS